nr:PEP-CTERM sorting domain-containing protein [Desulfobacula sp.]
MEGTYRVDVSWGNGTGESSGSISLSAPGDALGYTGNINASGASANAAAGIWGYGDANGWGSWLTDGTGVGQNDPSHLLGPTVMTISYDVFVYDPDDGDGSGQYAGWYDQYFLKGVVGGEGSYVNFQSDVSMWVGTAGPTEAYLNGVTWEYTNNTPGSFYIDSGLMLPSPFDADQFLSDGEYMHFIGELVFTVQNDGGPSSVAFTDSPPPVPEPASLLLFSFGLLGVAGVSRKKS